MNRDSDPDFLRSVHEDNLERAIGFLKFAEAKNGAAIAYSSAVLLSVLQTRVDITELTNLDLIGLLLCLAGGLIAARSFVPQLDPRSFFERKKEVESNLLYFGDIAKSDPAEFGDAFSMRYSSLEALIEDVAKQTSINSKIASDKMNHFTLSIVCSVGGTVCLATSLFFQLF